MSIWKLRLSILTTLAILIGVSTLFFTVILGWLGVNLIFVPVLVVIFNVVQWLIAPYIIDAVYGVRELSPREAPKLHRMVERLSRASGIKKPRLMLARVPIPNAFAYGSPIAGTRVAVTEGLLSTLGDEEVEAVLGHELGHLKHRDVQVMMFASVLPAIFYWIGRSLLFTGLYYRRDEERSGGAALIGAACLALYFLLSLLVLHLSRLREYYADAHSASIVPDGARKLSEALAKIVYASETGLRRSLRASGFSPEHLAFKSLFITDPECASRDRASIELINRGVGDEELVERLLSRRLTPLEQFLELFSTHPNIVKRLRALRSLYT